MPGNKDSFVWLLKDDVDGPSEPMTYRNWFVGQPDGKYGKQVMLLYKHFLYKFVDGKMVLDYRPEGYCYICEC